MNCTHYSSREAYYGVAGDVPVMTGPFWECEPEDEEVREYFLKWVEENREFLEPDYPSTVFLYCEECEEEMEFDITPAEVFSMDELFAINKRILDEDFEKGEIDKELYHELLEDLKNLTKGDSNEN